MCIRDSVSVVAVLVALTIPHFSLLMLLLLIGIPDLCFLISVLLEDLLRLEEVDLHALVCVQEELLFIDGVVDLVGLLSIHYLKHIACLRVL